MDESNLAHLVRLMPTLGHQDPEIRATAAQAAHRIVTDAGDCWQTCSASGHRHCRPRPSTGAMASASRSIPRSRRTTSSSSSSISLRNWHGTPAANQQATLENSVGRLVRVPIRLRF